MSSGTQVDVEWAGMDAVQGGAAEVPVNAPGASRGANGAGTSPSRMTEEEILGMDSPSPNDGFSGHPRAESASDGKPEGARHAVPLQSDPASGLADMPGWMAAAANDPKHAAEARELWQEHQAFRAAFSSAEEARAMKELLPGGAQEVQALRQIAQEVDSLRQGAESLREAAQSVDRIDAAIFSGDARAQSEVVAEMARANPAAFRSMFAEAAKVLAGMGAGGREAGNPAVARLFRGGELGGGARENLGSEDPSYRGSASPALVSRVTGSESRSANQQSPINGHQSPVTGHQSSIFDPAAYASFERSTNEVVARDVRGSIGDTLARVLPEGVADGAARRIGEDIFNEVHRALAADRSLLRAGGGSVARAAIRQRRAAARGCAAGGTREAACAQRGAARDRRMDQFGAGDGADEGGAAGRGRGARRYRGGRRIAGFYAAARDERARSELRVDERRRDFGNVSGWWHRLQPVRSIGGRKSKPHRLKPVPPRGASH